MGLGFKNPTKEDSYLKSATPRKIQSGAKSKRGGIPVRVDICERPAIADQKTEIEYWESDTIIGGNHLVGLRQKTNQEKPQPQSPLGIYFEKPKIAETQIYQ